jgi:hypothetical protein
MPFPIVLVVNCAACVYGMISKRFLSASVGKVHGTKTIMAGLRSKHNKKTKINKNQLKVVGAG